MRDCSPITHDGRLDDTIHVLRKEVALGRELQGVPDALVHFIDALPRNDMGKIQRDVLKKRAASLTAGESRQQRRRSLQLARKLRQRVRIGAARRD